jgi:hypothetical protein
MWFSCRARIVGGAGMSGYFNFLKIQYELKSIGNDQLKSAVAKSYIIADEYQQITGEAYADE